MVKNAKLEENFIKRTCMKSACPFKSCQMNKSDNMLHQIIFRLIIVYWGWTTIQTIIWFEFYLRSRDLHDPHISHNAHNSQKPASQVFRWTEVVFWVRRRRFLASKSSSDIQVSEGYFKLRYWWILIIWWSGKVLL